MMMTTRSVGRQLTLVSALAIGLSAPWVPAYAQVCANDPSRTIFAGGPGTEACTQINDQTTCEKAFHRSGAGPLAPCVWGGSCFGNTAGWETGEAQSCEDLPEPATCVDPTRTLLLNNTTSGPQQGDQVCGALTDEATCETAWHVGAKDVGIACCWRESGDCAGSAWAFNNSDCTHGNTCFASIGTGAPLVGTSGLLAVMAALLVFGMTQIRTKRRPGLSSAPY